MARVMSCLSLYQWRWPTDFSWTQTRPRWSGVFPPDVSNLFLQLRLLSALMSSHRLVCVKFDDIYINSDQLRKIHVSKTVCDSANECNIFPIKFEWYSKILCKLGERSRSKCYSKRPCKHMTLNVNVAAELSGQTDDTGIVVSSINTLYLALNVNERMGPWCEVSSGYRAPIME